MAPSWHGTTTQDRYSRTPSPCDPTGKPSQPSFFEEGDYDLYLDLLREAAVGSGTEIWCFWDALRSRRTRCRWHLTPVGPAVRRCPQIPHAPASSCGLAWTLRLASTSYPLCEGRQPTKGRPFRVGLIENLAVTSSLTTTTMATSTTTPKLTRAPIAAQRTSFR
jgi:hypothetical protein